MNAKGCVGKLLEMFDEAILCFGGVNNLNLSDS